MKRITTKAAAKLLNINVCGIQELMKQEKIQIGYAVKKENSSRYTYYIFEELVLALKQKIETEGKLF